MSYTTTGAHSRPSSAAHRRGSGSSGGLDRLRGLLPYVDFILVGVLGALSLLSVVMVLAATHGPRTTTNDFFFMQRQIIYISMGVAAMVAVASFDYRRLLDWWRPIYAVGLLGLVAVLILGTEAKGAQRAFSMAGFQIQPAEFMKVALVVAIPAYLSQVEMSLETIVKAMLLAGVPVGLIFLQPDLGTSLVVGILLLAVLLVAGAPKKVMFGLLGAAILAAAVLLSSNILDDFQKARLTNWVNPENVPANLRYNTEQSQIAVASGGLTGQGWMKGGQTSNGFVPEQQTDFIFTAIGEELGFVGAVGALSLYGVLLWRVLRTAQLATDRFGGLIAVAVFAILLFQIFENVGMSLGIMPVTGIPLPYMSYGGSSTLVAFSFMGLIQNIQMRRFT